MMGGGLSPYAAPSDIDPYHIDDYYYNPNDGNWYDTPPQSQIMVKVAGSGGLMKKPRKN
jgi:hypothetical protein